MNQGPRSRSGSAPPPNSEFACALIERVTVEARHEGSDGIANESVGQRQGPREKHAWPGDARGEYTRVICVLDGFCPVERPQHRDSGTGLTQGQGVGEVLRTSN